MAASSASPQWLRTDDPELGEPLLPASKEKPVDDASEEAFPVHYHVLYAFSSFLLLTSTLAWLFPFSDSAIVGHLSSVGGLATAAFLISNAELLVTHLRLMREVQRFKQNNQEYRVLLVEQKKTVSSLKESQKALKRLDGHCQGRVEKVQEELDEMVSSSRDTTRRNIILIMTLVRPKQEDVRAGEDLRTVLERFRNVYIRAIEDAEARFAELRKGLEASPRWQQVQSLSVNRLKFILASALFEDFGAIKDVVTSKVEAASDEVASGWYEDEAEAVEVKKWESQFSGPRAEGGGAAAAGGDDDWADAEAFAAGRQGEPPPALPKADSWADAVAFVNK